MSEKRADDNFSVPRDAAETDATATPVAVSADAAAEDVADANVATADVGADAVAEPPADTAVEPPADTAVEPPADAVAEPTADTAAEPVEADADTVDVVADTDTAAADDVAAAEADTDLTVERAPAAAAEPAVDAASGADTVSAAAADLATDAADTPETEAAPAVEAGALPEANQTTTPATTPASEAEAIPAAATEADAAAVADADVRTEALEPTTVPAGATLPPAPAPPAPAEPVITPADDAIATAPADDAIAAETATEAPADTTLPLATAPVAPASPEPAALVDPVTAPVDDAIAADTADATMPLATTGSASEAPTTVVPGADAATARMPEFVDATAAAAAAPKAEWAPKSDKPRRKRRWPWIVVPVAGLAVGLVVASTVLIAPGVSAAGVPIGGMTRDAAANAIADKLAKTTVAIDGPDGAVTLSSADLGASIDAAALADKAHNTYPLWNVTSWGKEKLDGVVKIDNATAEAAVRKAAPSLFKAPVEAAVSFNGTAYVTTESADGSGIAIDSVRDALQTALGSDKNTTQVDPQPTTLAPKLSTATAKAAVDKLNGAISTTGFYVGDDKVVPIDAATANSWISYTFNDAGEVQITADEAAIAKVVPTLAAKVDRPAVDGTAIIDQEGDVLEAGEPSQQGRKLGDTSKVAADFAKQLATGNGKFELPVTVTEPKVKGIERHIEVNLTEQRLIAWENGKPAMNVLISSGMPGTPTTPGQFRTNSRIDMQDMGCVDGFDYCTKNVPFIMFFNGDEGFHGTYWHNNFGTPMSHGCINLTEPDAQWLFNWAPIGTEVNVHY